MIRINIVSEGQTELRFVKSCLNKYFAGNPVLDSRCILTSTDSKLNYEHRGGLSTYAQAKNDILNWLKEDRRAYVSTMFDFFRLPVNFPDYNRAMKCQDHLDSIRILEAAMQADITAELPFENVEKRFIPYIQLHEFEALLFCDISVLKYDYLEAHEIASIDRLYDETKDIPPEEINHGEKTAPSKRLLNALAYRKGDAPSEWIDAITIDKIKLRCPHFESWLNTLQALPEL